MSRYLNNPNEVPSGGYRYFQKETNFMVTAPSWRDLLLRVKAHREANVLPVGGQFAREIEDWLCEQLPPETCTDTNPNRSAEMPRESWPLWVKALALLAKPGDEGIGDIVERTVGPFGGEAFKKFYEKTFGRSCGCSERAASWNAMWPLNK